MKNIIIVLFALLSSCSFQSQKNKWANEPHGVKYSKEREKEVWGHVLRGKDVALFYGTPVQKIAEAIVSGENSIIKDELKKLSPKDVNYQEGKFNIPLNQFAVVHGNFEALKILTEHGADPNIPSSNGETAFTASIGAAQNQGDNSYMKFLIANGANVNYENQTGTALKKASTYKLENVKLLVNAGADPHYTIHYDNAGVVHSPLDEAIMHDRIDIVNYYLFECGVDPHSITVTNKNTGTWTIIDRVKSMEFAKTDTASYKEKEKLIQYLREQGFKLRGEKK